MANHSSGTVATKIQSRNGAKRRKINISVEGKSSGDKTAILHGKSRKSKAAARGIASTILHRRSIAPEETRLAILENKLVIQSNHAETPFETIQAISNPGMGEIYSFPALQYWWESYRTTDVGGTNSILRLTQDVIFGSNVMSNLSTEAEARRECYALQEEVESRIIGFAPIITDEIEILFPVHDVDAAFSAIAESGLFILTTMYNVRWQINKPVRG